MFPDILRHNADVQFSDRDAFDGHMTVVQDYDTAKAAMTVIIDQGEGSMGTKDSHYNVFLDLHAKRDQWDCYPVTKNPTAESYRDNAYVYKVRRHPSHVGFY